jgi:hypothetical protein
MLCILTVVAASMSMMNGQQNVLVRTCKYECGIHQIERNHQIYYRDNCPKTYSESSDGKLKSLYEVIGK